MSDTAPVSQPTPQTAQQRAPHAAPQPLVVTSTRRIRTRARAVEAWLLGFALIVVFACLCMVQLGVNGTVTFGALVPVAAIAVLAVGFHILLRVVAANADPILLPVATALNGIGIAFLYRVDLANGASGWSAVSTRQIVWTVISLLAAGAVLLLVKNHRTLQRYTYIFMAVGIVLLFLPMLPGIGTDLGRAAKLWIHLGPVTIQPGEFAKIALAIFFAGYLATHRDSLSIVGRKVLGFRFPRARDLGPIVTVWLVSFSVLVFQRDLGTSLLYFGLFIVMIYVATGRPSWVVIGVSMLVVGFFAADRLFSHVSVRIQGWLDPWADPQGASYQLVTGMFGLASGGLIGTGLGKGTPTLTPLVESDFIYSGLGEELGLIGLFAILALYLLLVSRGLRIGFNGQDDFGRLLAVGLSFVIALQCFIVIGGVTRLIPLTGLTTPFLAAGGSSLVANWMIVAILLRVSDTVRSQPREVTHE